MPSIDGSLLDGRAIAKQKRERLKERIASLRARYGSSPQLMILLVGDEPDSVLYARNLVRWCEKLGMDCGLVQMDAAASQKAVREQVSKASDDPDVHGILVQQPLPSHLSALDLFAALDPLKDVEGQHPANAGLLASGDPRFIPTTPLAGMEILSGYGIELSGKHAVIVGRSNVVGKPLAQLMLRANATVTVAHSRTENLAELVRQGDMVAAAVGKPRLITRDMVKPGAVVLDFGINFVDGALVGDVAFEDVRGRASWITPVPGGIGPLTNLMLASNLLDAMQLQLAEGIGP